MYRSFVYLFNVLSAFISVSNAFMFTSSSVLLALSFTDIFLIGIRAPSKRSLDFPINFRKSELSSSVFQCSSQNPFEVNTAHNQRDIKELPQKCLPSFKCGEDTIFWLLMLFKYLRFILHIRNMY